MEYILSTIEMRHTDRMATEKLSIPSLILMENAGLKAAQCIANCFSPIADKTIGIFCGKGNNGGDGFVIGRHLSRLGAKIQFWLIGTRQEVKGDARVNLDIAAKLGLPIRELDVWQTDTVLDDYDILIDALLGTGLQGKIQGVVADIICAINQFNGTVVAVDTPSGLDCDAGLPLGDCVQADLTITMGNLKTGMLLYPGRGHLGELFIADLGVPDFIFDELKIQKHLLGLDDYIRFLPLRPPDAYKNSFGKVLVLAGSVGLTGAACLSSLAVLRSGAGMVILGSPKSLNAVFASKLTEVMTESLPETEQGSLAAAAFDYLSQTLAWCDVLAIGPGLSTHPETQKFVQRILREQSHPLVIDADGLNNLVGHTELLKEYLKDLVLTPHLGEFARLTNLSCEEIEKSRLEVVQRFAAEWQVVLLLKGAPTVVATPQGQLFINPTGNAGMATAGSGDVLTGLIVGFLAQGLKALPAALLGAFVHGLAGDRARWLMGQRGMLAGDILAQVPATLAEMEQADKNAITKYYSEVSVRLF